MLKGALVPETTLEGRPPGEKKLKKAKQAVNQEKKEDQEARVESKKRGREAMENAALLMACKEMGWHMPALERKVYTDASHREQEARRQQQELYEQAIEEVSPDDASVQQASSHAFVDSRRSRFKLPWRQSLMKGET